MNLSEKFLKIYLSLLLVLISVQVLAQENGNLLLISNIDANVFIDGEEKGSITANKPIKITLNTGDHYLQVISVTDPSIEKNEIFSISPNKQEIIKFEFEELKEGKDILVTVANGEISVPGLMNEDKTTLLFAFEKGDVVNLNFKMLNEKGTNSVIIYTYPDEIIRYQNDYFKDLENIEIEIKERNILVFSFSSNFALDRKATIEITRKAEVEEKADFNTDVVWKEYKTVVPVQEAQKFYINSGSHSTFQGGQSRITIPFKLPPNTISWYYEFTASREESEINNTIKTLDLVQKLTPLVDQSGITNMVLGNVMSPPGSDICSIYLLDHANSGLFKNKMEYSYYTEGTRENFKSGIVEASCCQEIPNLYLGIKNPDNFHGIHVAVDIAAIVLEGEYIMVEESN